MKIFISWSGDYSHAVAQALKQGLPTLFNGIDCFVSSESIRKGERWLIEVSKELDETNLGIACLAQDNLDAPWLHFETGAVSKSIKGGTVFTLLMGGLRPADIQGPLSQFQHTLFNAEDFFKLIQSINGAYGEAKLDETRLKEIFEGFWWAKLEKAVGAAAPRQIKREVKVNTDEKLDRLIETTNQILKSMPDKDRDTMLKVALERFYDQSQIFQRRAAMLEAENSLLKNEIQKLRSEREVAASTVAPETVGPGGLYLLDGVAAQVLPEPLCETLHGAGIQTLRELLLKTPLDLQKLGLDPKTIQEIMDNLTLNGLKLKPMVPPPRPVPKPGA